MTWEGLTPPYSTIVVDPPWPYAKSSPSAPRFDDPFHGSSGLHAAGAPLPYSTMDLDAIFQLRIGSLAAEDARVFMWITNRYLEEGWACLRAWGFTPMTRTLVWCKQPRGTMPVTTEFILIGRRGKPPRLPWHNTTWFDWPLQSQHSKKPAAFYDLVESWCPGPYVDVFSREPRLGWDHWGYGYEGAA